MQTRQAEGRIFGELVFTCKDELVYLLYIIFCACGRIMHSFLILIVAFLPQDLKMIFFL